MKMNKIFAALVLIMAVAFAACEPTPNGPENPQGPQVPTDSTEVPTDTTQVPVDTTSNSIDYLEGEISVAQALELTPSNMGDTTEVIKVRGKVKKIKSLSLIYGNAQFYLTDDDVNELYCYNIAYLNGEKFVCGYQLQEGDIVTVEARLYNYDNSGTSLPEMIKGNITRSTNTFDASNVGGPIEVSVEEAYQIGSELEAGGMTPYLYKTTGIVASVEDASTQYGNITFTVKDLNSDQQMIAYRLKYLENQKYKEGDPAIEPGDVVTILAQIKKHYDDIEFVEGYIAEHEK